MEGEIRVSVETDADLVIARAEGRAMAQRLGFRRPDPTLIATAISELARNIVLYAGRGEIVLQRLDHHARAGVLIIARDDGPGIPETFRLAIHGEPTRGASCLGLRGVRRLMDECEIVSAAGRGTTIAVKKWRAEHES